MSAHHRIQLAPIPQRLGLSLIRVAACCFGGWGALVWLTTTPVVAADVNVKARLNETVQFSDNIFLQTDTTGWTVGSYTSGLIEASARTPTLRFEATADFLNRRYFGPGISRFSRTETLDYGATLRAEHLTRSTGDREFLNLTYRHVNAGLAQLAETGFATTAGDVDTYNFLAGLTRQVTARDRFEASLAGSFVKPEGAGTATESLSPSIVWRRRLTSLANLVVTSQGTWLSYDNPTQDRLLVVRNTAGLETSLTNRITLRGQVGIISSRGFREGNGQPAPNQETVIVTDPLSGIPLAIDPFAFSGFSPDGRWSHALTAEMLLGYRLRTGDVSLYAGETVSPDILGNFSNRRFVGLSARYTVNRRENISGSVDFAQSSSGNTISDLWSIRASYNRQIAREWLMSLTYTFQDRTLTTSNTTAAAQASSNARANSVLISLSRDLTLVP